MEAPQSAAYLNGLGRRKLLLAGAATALTACSVDSGGNSDDRKPESRRAAPASELALAVPKAVDSPDIVVGAGLIPGMVNSSTDGLMVDFIKAISDVYSQGSIAVRAMTVGRLDFELAEGPVDMSMPYIRMRPSDDVNFNFRFTRQSYGKVSFVLFSRKAAPVIKDAIARAVVLRPFPYKIESAEFDWGFPVAQFLRFESAFKKLISGRIDAFLWAQEEADEELRRIGDTSLMRELYGVFDDVFAVQRNARGDLVERVYEQALESLRKSGKLQQIYSKIHRPFDPWQP